MDKKLVYHFLVFILVLSFSLFLNTCSKKVVREEKLDKQNQEEVRMVEDKISSEKKEELRLKVEREKAEREARLKEEALRIKREREEADEKEARLRVEFENEDIHFNYDKFLLTDEAMRILNKKFSWLSDHPGFRVEIAGHCDELGSNEYNMALGEKRANSAMKYLIAAGVKPDIISIISFGEKRPIDPGYDEEAWAKNRRAHFRILSD